MKAMEKDILTTAQTAKLLGVSVRTAQLLIEGGSVPSWKTPGGHRRVYRTDIEALIEGGGCGTPSASATVIVITPGDRIRFYEEVFAAVPECEAEIFEDLHAALFALGSARPHAIVVDLADGDVERSRPPAQPRGQPILRSQPHFGRGCLRAGEEDRWARSGDRHRYPRTGGSGRPPVVG